MKTVLIAALLLLLAGMAQADTWTYTGNSVNKYSMNPFLAPVANPCACSLSGSVTLIDAFTPVSWNFTDGLESFTDQNSTLSAYLGFAETKPTHFWSFRFIGQDGSSVTTKFWGSINDAQDQGGSLMANSNPGIWTESVPEPGALLLMGLGLALCVVGRSRLKRLG